MHPWQNKCPHMVAVGSVGSFRQIRQCQNKREDDGWADTTVADWRVEMLGTLDWDLNVSGTTGGTVVLGVESTVREDLETIDAVRFVGARFEATELARGVGTSEEERGVPCLCTRIAAMEVPAPASGSIWLPVSSTGIRVADGDRICDLLLAVLNE